MDVLVIRHAEAENIGVVGATDEDRPLTSAGRDSMMLAGESLASLVQRLDWLASSTLARARQTADILSRQFNDIPVEQLRDLSLGADPAVLLELLRSKPPHSVCALVGHEPDMSRFIQCCIGISGAGRIEMRKGSACLLRFIAEPAPGAAKLLWLVTIEQLRLIALGLRP